MLFYLAHYFIHYFHALRVFDYITFRAIISTLTAFFIAILYSPIFIRHLKFYQIGQEIRNDGPLSHLQKKGTPTMGGTLILISVAVSVLLCSDLSNIYIWITLFAMLSFGAIGYIDDILKVKRHNSRGLKARCKYLTAIFSLLIIWGIYEIFKITFPKYFLLFISTIVFIVLGYFFIVIVYFVLVGSSNAVNLTDGLDGLAILPTVLIAGALGIFTYVTGHFYFSKYLEIPNIPGAGELAVFCGAMVGSGFGFLWFNAYPAQVFMGDVGSLGLGAALGAIAIIIRQEIVFIIMSGIFVIETLSVILQVASFKLTGKRIFKMAPIHHHFELKGLCVFG